MRDMARTNLRGVRVAISLLLSAGPAAGQESLGAAARTDLFVGSELEAYTRVLQIAGVTRLEPWSVRGFADESRAVGLDSIGHPWSARYSADSTASSGYLQFGRPTIGATWNSALPFGGNDGALWAGRGLTLYGRAGVALAAGPLSVRIAPEAFIAQNASFRLMPNGDSGRLVYGDARNPRGIDLPQRFGDGAYGRLDAGQSHVRLAAFGLGIALSTENMGWGPATRFPFILGSNAAGIPRLTAGTTSARDLWLLRLAGQVFWGTLSRSPEFLDDGVDTRRFATGAAFVLTPRGLDGIEVGAARFYHVRWPKGGLRKAPYTLIFQDLLKQGLLENVGGAQLDRDSTNQLASAFGRIAIPAAGLEVYGELGREDHAYDLRDFLLSPEHASSRMAGVRRQWGRPERISALTLEAIDYRASLSLIRRGSSRTTVEGAGYTNGQVDEGHTNRGQLLGAPAGVGSGAAQFLTYERYGTDGRWTGHVGRTLRYEAGSFRATGVRADSLAHAIVEAGVSHRRFGGRADVEWGITTAMFLNRGGDDAFNVSVRVVATPAIHFRAH